MRIRQLDHVHSSVRFRVREQIALGDVDAATAILHDEADLREHDLDDALAQLKQEAAQNEAKRTPTTMGLEELPTADLAPGLKLVTTGNLLGHVAVVYQPGDVTADGRTAGQPEILVLWQHGRWKVFGPDRFEGLRIAA